MIARGWALLLVAWVAGCQGPAPQPMRVEAMDLNPTPAAETTPSAPETAAPPPIDAAPDPLFTQSAADLQKSAALALERARGLYDLAVESRDRGEAPDQWRPAAEAAFRQAAGARNELVLRSMGAATASEREQLRVAKGRLDLLLLDLKLLLGDAWPDYLLLPDPEAPPPDASASNALPPPVSAPEVRFIPRPEESVSDLRARWREKMLDLYLEEKVREPTLLKWLIWMYCEDRQFEEALNLMGELDAESAGVWYQSTMIHILDQLGDVNGALRQAKRLEGQLKGETPLSLDQVRLVESRYGSVEGFGKFTPRDSVVYRPGEYLKLYLEVNNYATQYKVGASFPSCDFELAVEVHTEAGAPASWQKQALAVTEANSRGQHRYPQRFQAEVADTCHLVLELHLPKGADACPSGHYVLVFTLTDHLRKRFPTAIARIPFEVR